MQPIGGVICARFPHLVPYGTDGGHFHLNVAGRSSCSGDLVPRVEP